MSNDNDESVGLDVALAVIHGMTSHNNAIANSLIDSLSYDADRYHVLLLAVRDLADEVDSRRLANKLYNLTYRVEDLSRDEAKAVRANSNLLDPDFKRIHLTTPEKSY